MATQALLQVLTSYPHMPIGKVRIYRLLFFVCLCVCTVTDFSADDKANGVKFCTVVYQRPGQGVSHFEELSSPEAPWPQLKIGRIGGCVGKYYL